MRARRRMAMGVVLALAMALSGCSDGGDDSDGPGSGAAGDQSTTTIAPSFSGAGGERFCELAERAAETLTGVAVGDGSPESIRTIFTSAHTALRELAEEAPAEIAADTRILADAYEALVDALEDADWEFERVPPEIEQALEKFEVERASDRLESYGNDICGVEPSAD